MKKIKSIFMRNYETDRLIRDEIVSGSEWVIKGEGIATRKYDGTCVKIEDGKYYKRYQVRPNKKIPQGFIEEEFDSNTGKRFGWVEVNPNLPENKWHMEAYDKSLRDGTYELCGPNIQGNSEKMNHHILIKHANAFAYPDAPRTYVGLKEWFNERDIEGLVFHHQDGRMAKVKKKDFGLKR
jgi:hypothetical protein